MSISGGNFSLCVTANQITLSLVCGGGKVNKRGGVSGISGKSSSRLLRTLNAITFDTAQFVTLTYRRNETDKDVAYADLRRLYKCAADAYGGHTWVWRRETQKRGAYHFHVFMLDTCYEREFLINGWTRIAGIAGDVALRKYGTHVVDVGELGGRDTGVLVSYLAKYAKKDGASVGRAWGVLGARYSSVLMKRVRINMMAATLLLDAMQGRGAVAVTGPDCPVVSYSLYLGHMGKASDANGETAIDFVEKSLGVKLESVIVSTGK